MDELSIICACGTSALSSAGFWLCDAAAAQRPGWTSAVKNGVTASFRQHISMNPNMFLVSIKQIMARKPAWDVVMEPPIGAQRAVIER